ncbi:MAG: hypothetical protein HFE81_01370 [Bacilli bacterium]|nr:hypothetical protein [Bacilli bacterium]
MKILKEPTLISWKIEKECSTNELHNAGCGAHLEIETADLYLTSIQKSYWSDYAESNISYGIPAFAFKCPCCDKETILDEEEIPIDVRESIKSVEKTKRAKKAHMKKLESK